MLSTCDGSICIVYAIVLGVLNVVDESQLRMYARPNLKIEIL